MNSTEFQDRLATRASLAKLDFAPALGYQLEAYYRLLAHWNGRINLTALPLNPITDHAIDRLLVEPLSALRFLAKSSFTWFDVGSGGGSPAIPLKLAQPGARLTMVESKERKAAFLREVVRGLNIDHASVEAERIQSVAENHRLTGTVDLITVRAVKVDQALLGCVKTLLRFGGQILLFGSTSSDVHVPRGFEVVRSDRELPRSEVKNLVVLRRIGL